MSTEPSKFAPPEDRLRAAPDPSAGAGQGKTPADLLTFIGRTSGWHQLALACLSVLAFAMTVAPLELQRRIINDALASSSVGTIATLAGIYVAIVLTGGLTKLVLNVYRGWVSETAVRSLRTSLLSDLRLGQGLDPLRSGIKVALIVDEAEPIGGFVGGCISEPVLQGGILISVFAYLIHLDPLLAMATFLVFSPQLVFVPLMQRAINRKVSHRIGTLRQISVGIVGGSDTRIGEERQDILVEKVFGLNMSIYRLKFSMNFLMNLIYHLGICAILALGGYWIIKGQTEVGTIVAFLSGYAQINDPWGDLVNWFRDLQVTQTKYRRIVSAVLDLQSRR